MFGLLIEAFWRFIVRVQKLIRGLRTLADELEAELEDSVSSSDAAPAPVAAPVAAAPAPVVAAPVEPAEMVPSVTYNADGSVNFPVLH
jgi:hypothetical protein